MEKIFSRFSRRLWDFVICCFRLLYVFFTWDRLTTFTPWQEDFSRQFAELRTELQQRNRHHSCKRLPQPGHPKVKSCQTFASMIWEADSPSPRFFQTFLFGHRHCDIPCVSNGRSIILRLVSSRTFSGTWKCMERSAIWAMQFQRWSQRRAVTFRKKWTVSDLVLQWPLVSMERTVKTDGLTQT